VDEATRAGKKLAAAAQRQIKAELPGFIRDLSPASAPSRLRLPTGESLSNATRMTALKSQCLFLARSVVGPNYVKASEEYEHLAKDMLFWVMRHAFNSGDAKGIFCCPACTLSLLPLLPMHVAPNRRTLNREPEMASITQLRGMT
jgi:hypothetical protein